MSKLLVRIAAAIGSLLLVSVVVGYIYIVQSDPLKSYGNSFYNNEHKHIFIQITNEGHRDITINNVKVNGNNVPEFINLGISYTGSIVSAGIEFEPKAKFVEWHEEKIHPRIKSTKISELIKDPNNNIPIHYGLQIKDNEDIKEVIITYRYLGITKSKKFEL